MARARIILKSGREQSILRYHPWVFSGAVKSVKGKAEEGSLVDIYSNTDQYLATGHYQNSSIAVRILSFSGEEADEKFFKKRFQAAYELRDMAGLVNNDHTNAFRFVNAEGDSLPGLIIDLYGKTAVMQMHSAGMYYCRNEISRALKSVLGETIEAIYDKSSASLPFKAGIEAADGYLMGKGGPDIVLENSHRFRVDWEGGQKTGFFVDQRENRQLVQSYSSGRKVLNMFCYTGGFSVYAMAGGAKLVDSVDASGGAVEMTRENVAFNFKNTKNHEAFATDAFRFFKESKKKYDLIILDPPAFAKHMKVLDNALKGYKRLNQTAIEKIDSGGVLFTFSCSQVVNRENFRKSVFAAAANSGRNVRILHQLTQPADHPVSIYHPEGEYLKGLVLKID